MKKSFVTLALAAALCALSAIASPYPQIVKEIKPVAAKAASAAKAPVEKGVIVDIQTSLGPIKVLLYDDTPIHRDNFLKLAREGFYDGVLFHRVIKDFMVQTGDPKSKNATPDQQLGGSDPGYTLEAEILYPKHYHKYGALAAARTGDQVNPERRSSSSQFYIVTGRPVSSSMLSQMQERMMQSQLQDYFRALVMNHREEIEALQKAGDKEGLEALRLKLVKETEENVKPTELPQTLKDDYAEFGGAPHLDGQYTVFGEVLEGMETVEKIQNVATGAADRPVEDVKIISMKVEE